MSSKIPHHVAIIMDGNGRWAERRHLPRTAGHKAGVETVRRIIEVAAEKNISILTLFAFGQENWRRPQDEVNFLMNLFRTTLKRETKKLHKNNIKLRIIGERTQFNDALVKVINACEAKTENNTGLQLNLAVNYSGHWDILQAVKQILTEQQDNPDLIKSLDSEHFSHYLATRELPEPDLFIRTSGEYRLSNFMLWQFAYTELFFTDTLWPDFERQDFENALAIYGGRQRRYGYTGQQLLEMENH